MKKCSICKQTKTLDNFSKSNRATGQRSGRGGLGVASKCKFCVAEGRKPGITESRRLKEAREAELRSRGQKCCTACLQELPFSSFSTRKASADGLNFKCRECQKQYAGRWREENPDANRQYYRSNRSARSDAFREWAQQNKSQRAEYMRLWLQENKDRVNEKVAYRNARKKLATVPWADRDKMRSIYEECARITAETGIPHEVDHIYPLQGETVSGLHWEGNLNIITQFENIQKLNRMPTESYLERCER